MPPFSLIIALFVVFLDLFGVGLIFPIASLMMFDTDFPLLPFSTSDQMRGIWLGAFLVLMPLCQFISAPLWGGSSDAYGRRRPLLASLALGLVGYLTCAIGIYAISIWTMMISRFLIGFASGNLSIVQAAIADLSTPEQKAKRYGLLGTALGGGFTLGPFVGGWLTQYGYHVPFLFTSVLIALNLIMTYYLFSETLKQPKKKQLSLLLGFKQIVGAFRFSGIRLIFLGAFFHNFGWSVFFEFIPVFLLKHFDFTAQTISIFYGVSGGLYALSSGLLIRPFVSRFSPLRLFGVGNIFGAGFLLLIVIATPVWLWILLIPSYFFIAFCMPSATTYISNNISDDIQGEALGTMSSIDAAAMAISPILGGIVVGTSPAATLWIGAGLMIFGGIVVLLGSLKPTTKIA